MEFRLLGPLEVVGDDGAPVPLGGRRPRALLAQLLLPPNAVVSTDRLIDGVWGESPPATAASALHVHVHALRQALGAERIETRPPGYPLRVGRTSSTSSGFRRSSRAETPPRSPRRCRSGADRRSRTSPTRRSRGPTRHGSTTRGSPRSRHASTQTSRPDGTTR